jgi:hypothetical protein
MMVAASLRRDGDLVTNLVFRSSLVEFGAADCGPAILGVAVIRESPLYS